MPKLEFPHKSRGQNAMIPVMPGDSHDKPEISHSPHPRRAPVPPRIRIIGSHASRPIEQVIAPLVGKSGVVQIVGPCGSGKSFALEHLNASFPLSACITMDRVSLELPPSPPDKLLVIASRSPLRGNSVATFEMAPWTIDDCMCYLAGVHRDRCKSVLDRLMLDETFANLEGIPRLICLVLDAMAEDESIATSSAAIRRFLDARLNPDQRRGLSAICLLAVRRTEEELDGTDLERVDDPQIVDLLRHPFVHVVMAAGRVAEKLVEHAYTEELSYRLVPEMVQEIARLFKNLPSARMRLKELIAGSDRRFDAMATSILLADDPDWRPSSGKGLELEGAYLAGAKWDGLDLQGARLAGADLSDAHLAGANLTGARAGGAQFRSAHLSGATLAQGAFRSCDFTLADLSSIVANEADFYGATFEAANLQFAALGEARFHRASFKLASLAEADLQCCELTQVSLEDADLGRANLSGAKVEWVRLREATCIDACFERAALHHCDLEGMDLPRANFGFADLTGSDLTGASMPRADFTGARLIAAGLAEVDWTGATLCDADFTDASFHMGSSRSGLVGSTIPCEGSKTGFYTDEYNDQDFKAPEEIRKANLRGCDLTGAKITNTDFYLVDLREARFTPEQGEHLKRTGAILQAR